MQFAVRRFVVGACLSAAMLAFASSARAQGGYTKENFPAIGIEFERARDYEQIPVPPDTDWIVLHYAEKVDANPREHKKARPEFYVLWIDWVPDPPPQSLGSGTEAPEEHEKSKSSEKPSLPINSFERWAAVHLTDYAIKGSVKGKDRKGQTTRTIELATVDPNKTDEYAVAYEIAQSEKHAVILLGFCGPLDAAKQAKIWSYTFEHMVVSAPESADLEKLKRKYFHSELAGVDYRVQVRAKLVRGWTAEDTPHFIVVIHTPDQPLVRKILADLEIMHAQYEKLFPPAKPIDAVSTVRICRDRGEYALYGGAPNTAGYWNWKTEELVLFDATVKDKNNRRPKVDGTFLVLYHEAFHQYIFYSTGELPPHSWFNEGTGDFFGGARVTDGKLAKIGPNPWRLKTIREAVDANRAIPWKQILHFEQPEYYDPSRVFLCYAEGWSMIFFLRTSKVVARNPRWSQILPEYFDALKSGYADELSKLGEDKAKDEKLRYEAGKRAREHAVDQAFDGIDLGALEDAWKEFVDKIESD